MVKRRLDQARRSRHLELSWCAKRGDRRCVCRDADRFEEDRLVLLRRCGRRA